MTHLINDIYAVEVPEGSIGHEIVQTRPETIVLHFYVQCGYIENNSDTIVLPPGNWQLICTTKEVTNERLAELFGHAFIDDQYAKESQSALFTSKGLDPNKNYVLIKKLP